ncbi:hypothetical protein FW756_04725 [Leucobacter sp. 1207-22]
MRGRLLERVRQHRFITTRQLMRLTRSSYGTPRSALRQTLRHLTTLRERNLIARLERCVGGWQGGSAVTIWTLTTKGFRFLTGGTARLRPHHTSTTFLAHLLAISETRVLFYETAEQYELSAEAVGGPSCWRRYLGAHGQTITLKPDLTVTVTSREFVDRYFLEVDRATENPARVIRKCWQYEFHRRTGIEQERHGVYPVVVWIVPHQERKSRFLRALDAETKLPRELFTVITLDELTSLIRDGPQISD